MTSDATAVSSPTIISNDWTDDKLILFLHERKSGDPVPSNVITDVDPFSLEPCNDLGSNWYLCKSKGLSPSRGGKIRGIETGYWKETENSTTISTGVTPNGIKISWEFFNLSGDKTNWMILEYHVELRQNQGGLTEQDFCSLCRIYFHNHVGADEIDVGYLESILLNMPVSDEENTLLSESAKKSQVVHCEDKDPLPISGRSPPAETLASDNFSNEDFLELKDFDDDLDSSSFSSDNSSMPRLSDDYFDSEALLREIADESNLVDGHPTDRGTDQVILGLPRPGSPGGGIQKDCIGSASGSALRSPQELGSTASGFALYDWAMSSHLGDGSRAKRAAGSRSPEGSGSSRGSERRSPVSRFRKLGKKYCCLGPF